MSRVLVGVLGIIFPLVLASSSLSVLARGLLGVVTTLVVDLAPIGGVVEPPLVPDVDFQRIPTHHASRLPQPR